MVLIVIDGSFLSHFMAPRSRSGADQDVLRVQMRLQEFCLISRIVDQRILVYKQADFFVKNRIVIYYYTRKSKNYD